MRDHISERHLQEALKNSLEHKVRMTDVALTEVSLQMSLSPSDIVPISRHVINGALFDLLDDMSSWKRVKAEEPLCLEKLEALFNEHGFDYSVEKFTSCRDNTLPCKHAVIQAWLK